MHKHAPCPHTHIHNLIRIAGLAHIGMVEEGKRADLLLLDEELNVQQTIVAGRTEFRRE